jgi:hypothetical protein
MANRKGYLAIALFLTVLDEFMAMHYSRPVRTAWSGDIWSRGLLVTLEALAITSLANVWAQAVSRVSSAVETQSAKQTSVANSVPVEPRGARDV